MKQKHQGNKYAHLCYNNNVCPSRSYYSSLVSKFWHFHSKIRYRP